MKILSKMMFSKMTLSSFKNSLILSPKLTIVIIVKVQTLNVKIRYGDTREFMMAIRGGPSTKWILNIKI